MCSARARLMLRGPLFDRTGGPGGELQAQGLIARPQGPHRVRLQVRECDVGKPRLPNGFAETHSSTNRFSPAVELLRAEFHRVVAVATPTTDVSDQAAHRTHDPGRITVAPHEFGVGVRLDERIECEHVDWRLEVPQVRWAVPL